MNSFHDVQVGDVEEDRLEVGVVVGEVGAAGCLGVIGWREEGEGQGMVRLENSGISSEGLSLTDLHWLGCFDL